MQSTDELVDIVLDVDWDKEPECEGSMHPRNTEGHDGGPAKYVLRTHCRGPIQICAGRMQLFRAHGAWCDPCCVFVPGGQLIFIEL